MPLLSLQSTIDILLKDENTSTCTLTYMDILLKDENASTVTLNRLWMLS